MKANRTTVELMGERAESGVGTMIIFIALVLVAAVAAAVLVGTSGMLQERATTTGVEATDQVASNIVILRAEGYRWEGSGDVGSINLTLELGAGSQDVDLSLLYVEYVDGSGITHYSLDADDDPSSEADHEPGTIDAGSFGLYWVRGSVTAATDEPIMEHGDLVRIHVELSDDLATREEAVLSLIPEVGNTVRVSVQAPPTFSGQTHIDLR